MWRTMLIGLDGLGTKIALNDSDPVVDTLSRVFGSWRSCPLPEDDSSTIGEAIIRVDRTESGFRISSPWLSDSVEERTATGAAFSVTAELGRAFAEEHPELFCLHGAAVEIGGRLI